MIAIFQERISLAQPHTTAFSSLASFWISRGETVLRAKADLQRQQPWPRELSWSITSTRSKFPRENFLAGGPHKELRHRRSLLFRACALGEASPRNRLKSFFYPLGVGKKNRLPIYLFSQNVQSLAFSGISRKKKSFQKNKIKKVLARRPRGRRERVEGESNLMLIFLL